MLPCPLCVIQRYLFIAIGVFALIGAYTSKPKALAGVGLLAALGGLGTAGKHLCAGASWPVLRHRPDGDLPQQDPDRDLPALPVPADGLCEDALAPWFGLSIPQWSFLWFGLFTLSLGWLLIRRVR
jgi:disulfide bond formation protein DsbB